ncbi:hypothetical protein PRUPE_2G187900 [Prunus persica]|uniref:Uncharacterized protein n=1 Tax=Prunus persica TaxID=3760 RepID=A0A251QHY5_PRUPE|nr:hypothetical protein PRUPE_2G187900 [Prunus persica]
MSNLMITTNNWWKIKNRANNEENLLKTKRKGSVSSKATNKQQQFNPFFHMWITTKLCLLHFICQKKIKL